MGASSTFEHPPSRPRASFRLSREVSIPTTKAVLCARSGSVRPKPQPRSRTVSPAPRMPATKATSARRQRDSRAVARSWTRPCELATNFRSSLPLMPGMRLAPLDRFTCRGCRSRQTPRLTSPSRRAALIVPLSPPDPAPKSSCSSADQLSGLSRSGALSSRCGAARQQPRQRAAAIANCTRPGPAAAGPGLVVPQRLRGSVTARDWPYHTIQSGTMAPRPLGSLKLIARKLSLTPATSLS